MPWSEIDEFRRICSNRGRHMTPARRHPAAESRQEAVARLAAKLRRQHSPRMTMVLVVGCAAGVGFLSSALMLWMRVHYMPVRYAIAGALGYSVFVALMNRWLGHHAEQSNINNLMDTADAIDALDIPGGLIRGTARAAADGLFSGGRSGGGGASSSFGTGGVAPPIGPIPMAASSTGGKGSSKGLSFDLDLDDGAKVLLPLLAIVAIMAGLVACASVIWSAPNMLAELLVDGAVAGAAYNRLRASACDWTFGVVRRTWLPAVAIIVTFVMLGAAGHHFKPEADSIGDFFR